MNSMKDRRLSKILVLQICLFTAKNMIFSNYNLIMSYNTIANILIIFICAALFGVCEMKYGLTLRINNRSIILLSCVAIFWVLSIAFHPYLIRYGYIINDITEFVAYSTLAIIIIPNLSDKNELLDSFYKYSYFLFVAAMIAIVLFAINGNKDINGLRYSMAYGKNGVFPCVILLSKFKRDRKIYDLAMTIAILFGIISISSRFPLLYVAAYIIVSAIFSEQRSAWKLTIAILFGIIMSSFYLFQKEIVGFILAILNKYLSGVSSRTLQMLLSGELILDSGRDVIHQRLLNEINKHAITGYGAGGAVLLLNGELAHGFLYDSWANFGYIFGTTIIAISILAIIRKYRTTKERNIKELMLILGCCFFPTISLQDGFWTAYKYWWLVALCL